MRLLKGAKLLNVYCLNKMMICFLLSGIFHGSCSGQTVWTRRFLNFMKNKRDYKGDLSPWYASSPLPLNQKSCFSRDKNHCKCSILIHVDAYFAVQVHYWSKSSINHMVNYTFSRYRSQNALYKLKMHWFISEIIIMKILFQMFFISSVFSMRHGKIQR